MITNHFNIENTIYINPETPVYLHKICHYSGEVRRSWPFHEHEYYEMSFTFHGDNYLRMNDSLHHFGQNDICLVAPNTLHGISLEENNNCVILEESDDVWELNFSFPQGTPSNLPPSISLFHAAAIFSMNKQMTFIRELLTRIIHCSELNPLTTSLFIVLFHSCLELANGPEVRIISDTSDDYIKKIIQYITDHYNEAISLDSLAQEFAISKSHLIRLFNQNFGISPIHHRIETQISAATILLNETNLSIAEISQKTGFSSLAYFQKIFLQHLHMTPGQFRKTLRPYYSAMRENGSGRDEIIIR